MLSGPGPGSHGEHRLDRGESSPYRHGQRNQGNGASSSDRLESKVRCGAAHLVQWCTPTRRRRVVCFCGAAQMGPREDRLVPHLPDGWQSVPVWRVRGDRDLGRDWPAGREGKPSASLWALVGNGLRRPAITSRLGDRLQPLIDANGPRLISPASSSCRLDQANSGAAPPDVRVQHCGRCPGWACSSPRHGRRMGLPGVRVLGWWGASMRGGERRRSHQRGWVTSSPPSQRWGRAGGGLRRAGAARGMGRDRRKSKPSGTHGESSWDLAKVGDRNRALGVYPCADGPDPRRLTR